MRYYGPPMKLRVLVVAMVVGALAAASALALLRTTDSIWVSLIISILLSAAVGWAGLRLALRSSLRGSAMVDGALRRLAARDASVHLEPDDAGGFVFALGGHAGDAGGFGACVV